jgi:hypothetical protein
MARKVVLLDDLTGEVIDEGLGGGTVLFSVDDRHFQIDLGTANKEAFLKDLEQWIQAAESIEAPPRRRAASSSGKTSWRASWRLRAVKRRVGGYPGVERQARPRTVTEGTCTR